MTTIPAQLLPIIDEMYSKGETAINIGKAIGIGKGRIFSYLKESGQIKKGGFKKLISSEKELEAVDLYNTGLSTSEVAERLNLGQSTIVYIIQKYGASRTLSESHQKYSQEIKDSAIKMYLEGHSLVAVAELHNIAHPASINQWLDEAGIPLRSRSEAAISSINHYMRGRTGEEHPLWKGGISYYPYCEKFTQEFRKRVREFFENKCCLCSKTREEEGRALQVHHVHYDKQSCCNENSPRQFILLCNSCHMKTNHNRDYWENYFSELINTKYGGKCYYTKEEYSTIKPK